jgi:hypothetical protein
MRSVPGHVGTTVDQQAEVVEGDAGNPHTPADPVGEDLRIGDQHPGSEFLDLSGNHVQRRPGQPHLQQQRQIPLEGQVIRQLALAVEVVFQERNPHHGKVIRQRVIRVAPRQDQHIMPRAKSRQDRPRPHGVPASESVNPIGNLQPSTFPLAPSNAVTSRLD